jgi:predicted ester cyclase
MLLAKIFTRTAPDPQEPIRGRAAFMQTLERILQGYSEFRTTIHDIFAEDDRVAIRLSHRAVNREAWTSRLGRHDVSGKPVNWSTITFFRFHEGKIVEEWVCRDELGMLIQLDIVAPSR